MDDEKRICLYNDAWKKWGAEKQVDMLIEEMAELTKALLKARRNGVVFSHNVYEEIADVDICMEQIKTRLVMFPRGISLDGRTDCNIWENHVMEIKQMKLERLSGLVYSDV